MKLWIRSQDREGLILAQHLDIYCVDEKENIYAIEECGNDLGNYKTKERALEVLDEIQNMIKPTLITTQYHSEIKQGVDKLSFDVIMQPVEDKITYIKPDTVIYEMPEE